MVKVGMVLCPTKPPKITTPSGITEHILQTSNLQYFKPFVQNEYMLSYLVVIAFYNCCLKKGSGKMYICIPPYRLG